MRYLIILLLLFACNHPKQMKIDGAVNQPGIYEKNSNDSLSSMLKKANGLKEDATNDLDLNKDISKLEQITIPSRNNCVDIAKLNSEEIMTIPGIGKVKLTRIIEYFTDHKYQNYQDLLKVKGIGQKSLEKIKQYLCY